MDLLIKGMEMPENIDPELSIEFAEGIDGKRYARLYHLRHCGVTEWCEVVPVPPHGRTIDAWKLLDDIMDNAYQIKTDGELGMNLFDIGQQTINAPTIIPASEEGET